MYPYGMTREEFEDFLKEYSDVLIDILLTAYSYTVEEIAINHMYAEAESYTEGWEVC